MRLPAIAVAISLIYTMSGAYASTSVNPFAPQAITLCFENETYLPWQIKDGKGLDVILMEKAAERVGVRLELIPLPWKRCLSDVERGVIAGAFSASFNEERAKFAVYPRAVDNKPDASRRVRYDSYTFYRAKGSKATWDGEKFQNLHGPIAAQWGYSIASDLRKKGVEVDDVAITAVINMRKVAAGRVEGAALLTIEGDHLLTVPEFHGKVESTTPPLVEKPYFLIFGNDYYAANKKLVDDLWAAVAKVRETKEIKALKQKMTK